MSVTAPAKPRFGLRIPNFALGPRTASLEEMGAYLRRAEDLGFDSAVSIKGDWDKIQGFMVEFGRKPGQMEKVYSNFLYVLDKGERPEAAHFKAFSGMDLPYWKEYCLLGEAEDIAERIRGKEANLGGCEHIVLNPL